MRFDMFTIADVLFVDTETTGVPGRSAKWDVDYMDYPHIVQLAWIIGTKAQSRIVYPDGWEIPDEAAKIHGITTEYARAEGAPFAAIIDEFVQDCHDAGLICGHNIHFDTGVIKANIVREMGWEYYKAQDVESALYKGKRIDTMRPAMKWVEARTMDGRLKFPRLEELFSRCFPGETFPAHDALEDCKAVARCLPKLLELGIVDLKIKEYPEEKKPETPETQNNGPILNDNFGNDKLPIPAEKVAQIENPAKITDIEQELLNQDCF